MLKTINGKDINTMINRNFTFVKSRYGERFDDEACKEIYNAVGEYPQNVCDISEGMLGDVYTFWTGEGKNITQWFWRRNDWPALIEDPDGMFDDCTNMADRFILGGIHINESGSCTIGKDAYLTMEEGEPREYRIDAKNTVSGTIVYKIYTRKGW